MPLTQEQVASYSRDGFVVPDWRMPPASLDRLRRAYRNLVDDNTGQTYLTTLHRKDGGLQALSIRDDWVALVALPGVLNMLEQLRDERQSPVYEGWLFPSSLSVIGHLKGLHRYHADISNAAGTPFWFHGLRNVFITVAECELMLPRSLTKRLVNHARPSDVTEGYAADWSVEQLREPAQRVTNRID